MTTNLRIPTCFYPCGEGHSDSLDRRMISETVCPGRTYNEGRKDRTFRVRWISKPPGVMSKVSVEAVLVHDNIYRGLDTTQTSAELYTTGTAAVVDSTLSLLRPVSGPRRPFLVLSHSSQAGKRSPLPHHAHDGIRRRTKKSHQHHIIGLGRTGREEAMGNFLPPHCHHHLGHQGLADTMVASRLWRHASSPGERRIRTAKRRASVWTQWRKVTQPMANWSCRPLVPSMAFPEASSRR